MGVRDFEKAEDCLRRALALDPECAEAYELLGKSLYRDGRSDEAAAVYRHWHETMPSDPIARHMFAATSGAQAPPRASDGFILGLYERAAETFDTALAALGYRVPQLLFECASDLLGANEVRVDVLDLGCGTGLCGELFRPITAQLTGVDLSPAMLEQARRRDCYDELVCEELMHYVERGPAAYGLTIAADVFCYLGELDTVFRGVAKILQPNGCFVFSVEASDNACDSSVAQLQQHGRFAHSCESIKRALHAAGLAVAVVRRDMLRFERGAPVTGLIIGARAGVCLAL